MLKRRIYLAARYSRKEEIRAIANTITSFGGLVTSSWLEEPHSADTQLESLTPKQDADYAAIDLSDLDDAHELLFFSESDLYPRGGRHVEFGYALGTNKQIYVIGPRENIFHYLHNVTVYDSLTAYLVDLGERINEMQPIEG